MAVKKYVNVEQVGTILDDITTKADDRFVKNVDVQLASTEEINAVKNGIWPDENSGD